MARFSQAQYQNIHLVHDAGLVHDTNLKAHGPVRCKANEISETGQ